MAEEQTRILVFSTLYPHAGEPTLGIFVENRLKNLLAHEKTITATVIAPVPWFPFKNRFFRAYGRAAMAKKQETKGGVKVYHPRYLVIPKIGMMLTPYFLFLTAWRCYRQLIKNGSGFDLIDAHYLFPDGVAASLLAKKVKLPFVATARGSDVTQIGLLARPRKKIMMALRQAAHTITVSSNLKNDLVNMGANEQNISVLRNGVDLEKFQQTDRENGRSKYPKGPIMLFAGWLIPRKRLDLVLEVTRLLPLVTTVIVGDGPLLEACKMKAKKLGVESRIFFVGQKSPEEMPAYFSLSDVLLLPSDREGWANVLLEAMACGTPVVTRAVGGAPDLIQETTAGRVVGSDKPAEIASAVQDLLDKMPDRASVRKFAERFDWTETSIAQKKIFDQAIANFDQQNYKEN